MSKFLEYLSLIPKAISNPKVIAEGWINEARLQLKSIGVETLSEEEEAEIVKRRAICESCPLNSMNARISKEYRELYGIHYQSDRNDLHCAPCGCPIISKTASFHSECGLETYNSQHPNNKQPLKWQAFKKPE